MGRFSSYQQPTALSKTYTHPLSALHSSHQIKFLLRSSLVLYLQNVLLEQHKHVTMRTLWGVSHRVKPASWSFTFLFFASHGPARAYQELSLSLCLFCRLFLENMPLRMCKLRSCFGGTSPDQGGLKLSELDKWAREWPQLTVPEWPHTVLWQARHGWQEARVGWVISERQDDCAHTHTHISTHPPTHTQNVSGAPEVIKPITKCTTDWHPSAKKEVKAS